MLLYHKNNVARPWMFFYSDSFLPSFPAALSSHPPTRHCDTLDPIKRTPWQIEYWYVSQRIQSYSLARVCMLYFEETELGSRIGTRQEVAGRPRKTTQILRMWKLSDRRMSGRWLVIFQGSGLLVLRLLSELSWLELLVISSQSNDGKTRHAWMTTPINQSQTKRHGCNPEARLSSPDFSPSSHPVLLYWDMTMLSNSFWKLLRWSGFEFHRSSSVPDLWDHIWVGRSPGRVCDWIRCCLWASKTDRTQFYMWWVK